MRLLVVIDAVCTANGLQQCVVLHGLIQIHALQYGRVKSCEQFACDDNNLQRIHWIAETIEDFAFLILGTSPLLIFVCFIAFCVHHNGSGIFPSKE